MSSYAVGDLVRHRLAKPGDTVRHGFVTAVVDRQVQGGVVIRKYEVSWPTGYASSLAKEELFDYELTPMTEAELSQLRDKS